MEFSSSEYEFTPPNTPPSARRNRYELRSGSRNGYDMENRSSSQGTPRQSPSVISPPAGSALFQTPRNSSRRSSTRGFSSGRDSSSDSTSSNPRKDSLRSACRIAGRCICNSVDCGVLPARSSSSVRNMVTAPRSSRTPHSQHRTTVNAGMSMSNGTFVTPLTRPRLTESEIRQLQQMNLNQRRSGSTGRNGNGKSAGQHISTVMKDKDKSSGRTAAGSSASLLEEYNSTASYSSTTLNTSSTLLISSTRSTRSTKSSGYDSGEVTTDTDTSRSKSSIVEDTSGSSHSRTMEESQIFKRNHKQNQQASHDRDRDRVRFSFGMSSDEDEAAGVLSSRFPIVEDDRLSNSTTQSAVSAISQASERSIKIIKDVYQATKNCGSRIVSAAGGAQQQDSNGTSVTLKSSLKKRPEIIYSSSSRSRDSNSQNHNSSYRGFSCDNANNSFYTERRRRAKEQATAAALSSRYDSDSEWYDEDEEESSMSMSSTRSFMSRIGNSAGVLAGFLCAPIYWILVQCFVFEKWLLNSTSRSHSRAAAAGLAAGDSRTTADVVYGAVRHQHPKIPDHTCNPNPTPTGVGGGGDRPRGPRRRNDVNGGAAAATRATRDAGGDGGDGSSSPVFWRLLLILIPLLLCGYGCYYYGGAGDNTQNTATLFHTTETASASGRSIHASLVPPADSLPPTECPPRSVPATECPLPPASTTASSTSSEDLLRVSKELAELRQQMLASQSVLPPECPTCHLYDDTAMKEEDKLLKQYVVNLENRIQELTANLVKLEAVTKEKSCPDPVVPPNPAESVRSEQTVGAVSSQETRVIVDQYLEKKMGTLVESMSAQNRELIRAAINQYDADKTGRPDLALESGGGSVVSTRCTKKSDFAGSYVSILGFPVFWPSNSPRRVIQPGMMPGDCWSFDGAEGFIVLKLVAPTRVTGFTLEHLPKSISPLGHIDSAPKKFQVVGLTDYEDLATEFVFGEYQYDDNNIPIQYFDVQNSSDTFFPYVELKILSNHGNLDYTCLYRFRVHGYLESWLTIGRS